ncbi:MULTISPECIES: GntR family transcriptional regulator [Streptomyces]|uniref:GntR family transcriptional regulator n=1 Tax=Streptomyces TaxID=1883 RepID=UPI00163BCE96|nr:MULTISPECIES: GntR family transcriptional regulator [Streptomyces]MBC2879794.1 GntR family transcriptional regulator [Streptomyces sp. TYQ1024]UBI41400.1 GntR family transcriptional regulator [Streptomyces mobaraensis]
MAAKYEEIARDLRERISSGELPPGSPLPLMRDVAAQYGVSDITVRKAWNVLTREGLIEGRRRAGMFVREHPDRIRLTVRHRQIERDELGYYSGPEVQHWRPLPHPGGDRTRITTAPVPADVADALGVAPGTPLTVRKRILGDPEIPEYRQLADSWLADWVTEEVPALQGDTGLGGMYDRLEEWSGKALHWREEVSARMPSPDEAAALMMPPAGVPLLRALRVTLFPARGRKPERIAEVQDIRMSAALFAVGYPVPRGASAKWPVRPATADFYEVTTPKP